MHQPYYVNPCTGEISTPALVFRTLFNYYPMAVMAQRHPGVKLNFNLTPVLLKQIGGISSGKLKDSFLSLLEEESDVSPGKLLNFAWELPEQALKRYKIINVLKEKMEKNSHSKQDIFDLSIYLHLVCFHPAVVDEQLEQLLKKGRNFDGNDKNLLREKEKSIIGEVIEKYAELQKSGQIEISTSPMMHPIMPLLYSTDTAKKTKTALHIPENLFAYPEDAEEQLASGIREYANLFGRRPSGIWPSEGSLSGEVLDLFSKNGISWTATDEHLLAETLSRPLSGNEHYGIWEYRNGVSVFFRDHRISDLIGFAYQKMQESDAVLKLTSHLHDISGYNKDSLVTIILDGENPWDFYPDFGAIFLPALYNNLSESKEIKTVTATEALNAGMQREKLDTISPGSWMGVNFDNWIGKEPANKAWEILGSARKKAEDKKSSLDKKQLEQLREAVMIAESSDWFWWYSLPAEKKIKIRFDDYFRSSIRRIYEITGDEIPEFLSMPVEEYTREKLFPYIKPFIDGKKTHFYEWREAVCVDVSSLWATFKPVDISVKKLFYGYDEDNLYVRIDFEGKQEFSVLLSFRNSDRKTFAVFSNQPVNDRITAATDEIMEIRIPRKEITDGEESTVSFTVKIKEKSGQEIELPAGRYFKIHFAEKEENWIV